MKNIQQGYKQILNPEPLLNCQPLHSYVFIIINQKLQQLQLYNLQSITMEQNKILVRSLSLISNVGTGSHHKNLSQIRDIVAIVKKKSQIKGVSDIKQSVSSIIKKSMILGIRCEICCSQKDQEQFQTIANCEHRYCGDCLLHYISAQLALNNITLKCINQNCQKQFNEHCLTFMRLSENQKLIYYKLKKQQEVFKNKNQKFCPTPDCQGILNLTEEATVKCKICNIQFCTNCLLPFHVGSCDNYVEIFLEDNYNFMKCKSCNSIVQKIDGCDHITCRCGYQFCYLCGGFWIKYHSCPEQLQRRRDQQQRTFCQIVGVYLRYILFIIFGFLAFIILSILIQIGFIIFAPLQIGFQFYRCAQLCIFKVLLTLLTYPFLMIAAFIYTLFNFQQMPILYFFRVYINYSRYILTLR